jgi:hypothetical protein
MFDDGITAYKPFPDVGWCADDSLIQACITVEALSKLG